MEEWRLLHTVKFHDSKYYPGDQIKRIEMGGACGMYGERRRAYGGLEGKFEGKRPLGKSRLTWEDIIKLT